MYTSGRVIDRIRKFPLPLLFPLLIPFCVLVAYANSFEVPFHFDDSGAITDNKRIRQLWPPWRPMIANVPGETIDGRPLLGLSLALNYAACGLKPAGYHAVNLAIHIAAALFLYGALRRGFLLPRFSGLFGGAASPLAGLAALAWALHPLQTESVTYISQRTESMMGMFYLAAFYFFLRGAADASCESLSPEGGEGRVRGDRWFSRCVWASALGMATKEVMVTAPIAILLLDRALFSPTFRGALFSRREFYAGLAATWLVLGAALGLKEYRTLQDAAYASPAEYLFSQFGVVLHYLRLSIWPHPLCFDYGWPVARGAAQILPPAAALAALAAVSAALWRARPAAGFLGTWFFLVLAPTSSVMPIHDLAFEHRMYLPLAAVVVCAVLAGFFAFRRLGGGRAASPLAGRAVLALSAFFVLGLGTATFARNRVYRDFSTLWNDVLRQRPGNPRAHVNVGDDLFKKGDRDRALEQFQAALRLSPNNLHALRNVGVVAHKRGNEAEALEWFTKAAAAGPGDRVTRFYLGVVCENLGRAEEARSHYEAALLIDREYDKARERLGRLLAARADPIGAGRSLAAQGRFADAAALFREAWQADPTHPEAGVLLARALESAGKLEEAEAAYRDVVEAQPGHARAWHGLGGILGRQDRGRDHDPMEEAAQALAEAVRIDPAYPEAHNNLGNALDALGKRAEAIAAYRKAIELRPDYLIARFNLGRSLEGEGDLVGAAGQYRAILGNSPHWPPAANQMAWIIAASGDPSLGTPQEALDLARDACAGGPPDPVFLDTLAAAEAHAGRFEEAARTAAAALALAHERRDGRLADDIRGRLETYKAGRPWRKR